MLCGRPTYDPDKKERPWSRGVSGGRQVLEKDIALAVSTRLAALLRAAGYRVVMSRIVDSSVARLSDADSLSGAMTASAVHRDLLARSWSPVLTFRITCMGAAVLGSVGFHRFPAVSQIVLQPMSTSSCGPFVRPAGEQNLTG